ncbi:MAG TPA: oxygen-independent coproporphyrinogen III oxidase, partial [Kiloniellales bacterium]
AMATDLLSRYDQRVPRYTSYPTAPQFHAGVQEAAYRRWLAELDAAEPLSVYVHVPFCDSLCWFCGCHTKIVRRHAPVAAYLDVLLREIELVAGALPGRLPVCHLHLGGGTPTMLASADMERLFGTLRRFFAFQDDADIAVEIDPRAVPHGTLATLGRIGVNRASLGVQDLNPRVQKAVNRVQSLAETREVTNALRRAGIKSLNIDLMYGLPHQTVAGIRSTIDAVLGLAPDRLCLFGYAHVPWMKRHQKLIDEAALPGTEERFAQYRTAAERLQAAGYVWIGLDHFARPDDPLAVALSTRRLHRNFQGYTTDGAHARLGFGPSAIGALPQGFVQNAVAMSAYWAAVDGGHLPVQRGLVLSDDDRLQGAVIEQLMCYLEVDLAAISRRFGRAPDAFGDALDGLADPIADRLVTVRDGVLRVTPRGRPFVRTVCAQFDTYLAPDAQRHARAV